MDRIALLAQHMCLKRSHISPLEGWYSRYSLCYGAGARVAYIRLNTLIAIKLQNAEKKNKTSRVGSST